MTAQVKSSIIVDGKFYQVRTIIEAPHPIDKIVASILKGEVKL